MNLLKYNEKYIEILEKLSLINESIVIERVDDNNILKSGTTDGNIFYMLTSPSDTFSFDGEDCCFRNFKEFFKLYSILDKPKISQNKNYLQMSKDKSEIKFVLSDSETVQKMNKNLPPLPDTTTYMTLSTMHIKKIKSLCSSNVLNTNKIKIHIVDDSLTFTLFSDKHANTYKDTFTLTKKSDIELEFVLFTNIFMCLPENDYKWSIFAFQDDFLDRLVCLTEFDLLTQDNFELKLYTAEVE